MLALLRMDLDSFRSFRGKHSVDLDLADGVYYVTGKNMVEPELEANGAGKSTLFEAMYWCLTGRLMTLSVPGDKIVPWGADSKRSSVKLWFEIDGTMYALQRQRAPNKLFLKVGDAEPRHVEQYEINTLLGLNEETLKRTLFLGQFSTLFLDMKPEAQSAMFSEVLSLDRWLVASVAATKKAGEIKLLADKSAASHVANSVKYDTLYDQWENVDAQATTWAAGHKARLAAGRIALDEARKAAGVTLAAWEGFPEPPDASAAIVATREANTADKALAAKKQAARAALQEAQRRKTREADLFRSDKEAKVREAARHKATMDRFAAATTTRTCPECGQSVAANHLAERLAEAEGLHVEAIRLATAYDETIAAADAEAVSMLSEIDVVEHEIAELLDTIAEREAELAPTLTSISAAREKNLEAKFKHNAALLAVTTAETAMARIESETNTAATDARTLNALIRELNILLEKEEAKGKSLVLQAERVQLAATYFKEIRLSLIEEVLLELQITSNEYAEALGLSGWSIAFATERETKAGTTSIGFTASISPPGQPPVVWELFSGGERQRWQLAVSFGLSEVLLGRAGLNSNIEVLDEPTKGLSAGGVDALIDHLRERARHSHKAILLVDHHALDRGAFDKVWTVIKDDTGSRLVVR